MEYLIVILVSYLIGSVSPAALITQKLRKIDIRDVNSKNAGTSNVVMTLGLKWGVLVGVLDILKGTVPVLITRIIFPDIEILWFISGLSSIMGHIYPPHMGFKGGKGTATFGGVCIAIFPLTSLVLLILFFVILKVSDFIAVPTVLAVIVIPIGMYFTGYELVSVLIVSVYSLMSIYKHWPNLVRIYKKTEVGLKEGLSK